MYATTIEEVQLVLIWLMQLNRILQVSTEAMYLTLKRVDLVLM